MKRLQVLLNGQWEYVFCRNDLELLPVTTKDRKKAVVEIYGDGERILEYYYRYFGDLEFRLV